MEVAEAVVVVIWYEVKREPIRVRLENTRYPSARSLVVAKRAERGRGYGRCGTAVVRILSTLMGSHERP